MLTQNGIDSADYPMLVYPKLASILGGSDEAIFVAQVHYWLSRSGHLRPEDGQHWIWNSVNDWLKQFVWMSERTLRRIIRKLEKLGVLLTDKAQKHAWNHTKWYRLDYAKLVENGWNPCKSRLGQNGQIVSYFKELTIRSKWPDRSGQNDQIDPVKMTRSSLDPEISSEISSKKKEALLKISEEEEEEKDSLRSTACVGENPHTPLPPPPQSDMVALTPPSQGTLRSPLPNGRYALDMEPPTALSEDSQEGEGERMDLPNAQPLVTNTSEGTRQPLATLEVKPKPAGEEPKISGDDQSSAAAPTEIKAVLGSLFSGSADGNGARSRQRERPRSVPAGYFEEASEVLGKHQVALEKLGIDLGNETLQETVNAYPHNLEPAIEAFFEKCAKGAIEYPERYLNAAIRQGWQPRNQTSSTGVPKSPLTPEFLEAYKQLCECGFVELLAPEYLPVVSNVVNVRVRTLNPRPFDPLFQSIPWTEALSKATAAGLLADIGDDEW